MKTGLEVGKRPSEGRKDKTNNPSERWCWPELEEWWLWESRDSEGQCVLLVFFFNFVATFVPCGSSSN